MLRVYQINSTDARINAWNHDYNLAPVRLHYGVPNADILDNEWYRSSVFAEHYYDVPGLAFARADAWLRVKRRYVTAGNRVDWNGYVDRWSFHTGTRTDDGYQVGEEVSGSKAEVDAFMQEHGFGRLDAATVWYMGSLTNRFRIRGSPYTSLDLCYANDEPEPDMASVCVLNGDQPWSVRGCAPAPAKPMVRLAWLASAGDEDVRAALQNVPMPAVPDVAAFVRQFCEGRTDVIAPASQDDSDFTRSSDSE